MGACATKKNVVLSYAVFGIFGGEKKKAEAGFTDQDYWDYHEMDEARAEYGPAFSKENMTKFMEKTVYSPRLINIPPSEPDCFEINNNDTKSNTAFEQLNKIAGLPWKKVDTDAIAQINYERYKNM